MQDKIINTVYITDDKYALITAVSIMSLKKHKNCDYIYNVYVLASSLSVQSTKKLNLMSEQGFAIKIIEVKPDINEADYVIKTISATPTSMFKFKIPNLLPGIPKVIYLDSDMIVQTDLAELWSTNLEDYYAAAVPENTDENIPFSCKRLNLTNTTYFNSGLLFLNLEKMREENITEKLIDYRKNGINFLMDQDAINAVMGKNIKPLSVKYNVLSYEMNEKTYRHRYNIENKKIFTKGMFCRSAKVLHLAAKDKPWKRKQPYFTSRFMRYYRQTPFRKIGLKPRGYISQWKEKIYEKIYGENGEGKIYKFLHALSQKIKGG